MTKLKDYKKEYKKAVDIAWEYSMLMVILGILIIVKELANHKNIFGLIIGGSIIIISYLIAKKSNKKRKLENVKKKK